MVSQRNFRGISQAFALFGFLVLLPLSSLAAPIDVDGTPLVEVVVPGITANGIADGYDLLNSAIPSSFSTNFLVLGDETKSSAPIPISQVPYTSIGGTLYFAFVYDLQETNNNEEVVIEDVTISVTGIGDVWTMTDSLILNFNGTSNLTLTPLGNGADMALFIPVSVFDGLGLTGSNTIVFTSTQSGSNNGNDEWILTDRGVVRPGCDGTGDPDDCAPLPQFAPDEAVSSGAATVPEPASIALLGAGVLLLVSFRRKRNKP